MSVIATSPVKGKAPGQTLDVGADMKAWLLQEGYARDTAASGDTGPTRTFSMADNPQNASFGEEGADTTDEVTVGTEAGTVTSFTVTIGGVTSASVAGNVSAANLQTALQAMSNIGAGNVLVTGSAGGPYTLTFAGALADKDIGPVTATVVGGGTVTFVVSTQGGASTHADA